MDSIFSGSSFKGFKLIGFINMMKKYYVQANILMLVHTCRQVQVRELMLWIVLEVNGLLSGKFILDPACCVTKYL